MRFPKLRELKEALGAFFSAPYTTRFPKDPEAVELPDGFRGLPRYDPESCVGCGACAEVCPSGAITMEDDPERRLRTLQVHYARCMNCGQCEEKCITAKGIRLSKAYALILADPWAPEAFERVEKELLFCEICGAVIGCVDHFAWIKERLGAKAYAHPNLLIWTQSQWTPPAEAYAKSRIRREDQIKTVCAKCRYRVVVADEF